MSDRVYRDLLARVGEQHPQPRLEPTRRLVDLLGNPQDSAPVIHITGTNGKTSTARMIESLLRATGLRTGLLTSPHLDSFTERIVIDGEPITESALERNWDDIAPYIGMVDAELAEHGEVPLTFFEALTGLAFACFADAPVDVMVIEVGMGGEWDSTNVANATVAVFAPVGLDHLGRIGDTLDEIAQTKAGIIKPDSIVVSAAQEPSVANILHDRALELGLTVRTEGHDFALREQQLAVGGQLISVRGRAGEYPEVFLPLFGAHQAENAALALAAVESLLGDGAVALSTEVVEGGLGSATSPGRLEVVGVSPSVVVDGAHNPHGIHALVASLADTFGFGEVAVVLAVLAEKDARGILRELSALSPELFITQSQSDRALSANELAALAQSDGLPCTAFVSAIDALDAARDWAGRAEGRGVLVTGSLTLVAEARRLAATAGWSRP